MEATPELDPPARLLMGPGPSDVSPRVLRALAAPTVGHLDPYYLGVMNDTRRLLQHVFRTDNELTMPMSATGMAGMETCIVNLVEPGDEVLVGVNGVFGTRMCDVAERAGATVHRIETEWGKVFTPDEVKAGLDAHPKVKLVGLVHAETSTGAHQPLEGIGALARERDALLLVDCVTSLGGAPVEIDAWQIDAAYSGTQKCLSCPPGLSPVTFGERALARMDARTRKVQSWYLDLSMIRSYWGAERAYHHTAPVNMTYALREALRMVHEEGLEARFERHRRHHRALRAGLEALGLTYIPDHSLPMLNAVAIPDGVDDKAVRGALLREHGIEIGGGLGPFAGRAWRIGLMGASCSRHHVTALLGALGGLLGGAGDALSAADAAYA
ncbi:MAG: alanine--glyoxylate aminotransferase family protein [Sandaracinaceae bacterium]|nr:alanine--glyoxylate aminotransferase family protein [Sandaracinaceae bacterium]